MEKNYDFVFVGAGLYNAVFAYVMSRRGYKCLVIDKRDHTGGNCHCDNIEGINVHSYGPHIFHTSNKAVWRFVRCFVKFNSFKLYPIANYHGDLYNLPFNMNTFCKIFNVVTPAEVKECIEKEIQEYKTENPKNLEEQAINLVGKSVYEKLIKGYTEKQWHKPCTELPPEIIKRLPVRFIFNNNYFDDKYQGIPEGGYNKMFDSLLKYCEVSLNTDFFLNKEWYEEHSKYIIYSGMIDRFFNYCFGKLEYRDLEFKTSILPEINHQGCAVMNYTSKDVPYTRKIEHKHFECTNESLLNNIKSTVITEEYPKDFTDYEGTHDPYYPINNERNNSLYEKYKEEAEKIKDKYLFGGRLGKYKYFDMDDVIAEALNDVIKFSKEKLYI